MVGMWTPEPPREPYSENLSTSGAGIVIVEQDSSDSEEENAAYAGYELLPQLPTDPADSGNEDMDETMNVGEGLESNMPDDVSAAATDIEDIVNSSVESDQSNFENERRVELREVWSSPSSGSSIEMDSEQAEQVRAAMANFALPASAIPTWASAVPEEQWKQQLLDRIQRLQQRRGDDNDKT